MKELMCYNSLKILAHAIGVSRRCMGNFNSYAAKSLCRFYIPKLRLTSCLTHLLPALSSFILPSCSATARCCFIISYHAVMLIRLSADQGPHLSWGASCDGYHKTGSSSSFWSVTTPRITFDFFFSRIYAGVPKPTVL